MQIQRISNYQAGYKKSQPVFGLKIIKGENLQKAIEQSPAKMAIEQRIDGILKQYADRPHQCEFEISKSNKKILSIKTENVNTVSSLEDPTLAKPSELIKIIRETVSTVVRSQG